MPKLSTGEIETIVKGQHVGLVLLMPGSALRCPGRAIIVQEQNCQFAYSGCDACAVHAIRGAMQNNQKFVELLLLALDPSYNP